MSQTDILDWLIEQRRAGHHEFFSTKDIGIALAERGSSNLRVFVQVRKLEPWLEFEMINLNRPRWRVKDKYV